MPPVDARERAHAVGRVGLVRVADGVAASRPMSCSSLRRSRRAAASVVVQQRSCKSLPHRDARVESKYGCVRGREWRGRRRRGAAAVRARRRRRHGGRIIAATRTSGDWWAQRCTLDAYAKVLHSPSFIISWLIEVRSDPNEGLTSDMLHETPVGTKYSLKCFPDNPHMLVPHLPLYSPER